MMFVVTCTVVATNAYLEAKEEFKPAMYLRFKQSPLTRNEMIRYIGVYLLLSVNSVCSYRKPCIRRSSEVNILSQFLHTISM